jgi:Domain of unknown function (DUF4062)
MASPTMPTDRRYQVFISSTFDLQSERKAAIEGVFERGHIPIALERFSPANLSDLQVIENAMDSSQVYILILGHRYGEVIPKLNISYTEFEYDLAQRRKLHTLVFLFKDDVAREKRNSLKPSDEKERKEISNDERYWQFREKLKERFRKPFAPGNEEEFKLLVALALSDSLKDCSIPGYVLETLNPMLVEGVRNEFIGAIVSELRNFEKLYDRLEHEKEKKRAAAKYFVECYMDYIRDKKVSLFFESGSTICFVVNEMSSALKEHVKLAEDGSASIQISTNNVLAYLLLWLNARIPCTTFPWSPPVETTYGAAYGRLKDLADLSPDYSLPPLDENARREIKRLLETLFTLSTMRKPTLLLGAASGLQLASEPTLHFEDEQLDQSTKDALAQHLRQCFGPHVGSYHNKVFKRFMYETGLPLVIFMTSEKINAPIEVGKCHFILDREYTWQQFAKDYPVAFCVGCSTAEKPTFVEMFIKLGFRIVDRNVASSVSAFIARNEAFIHTFENAVRA